MKKVFSVLVAIAMIACLCVPAFAADGLSNIGDSLGDLSSSLGGLDLSGFDIDGIKEAAGNLEADLAETDILGTITGALSGLIGGGSSSDGSSESGSGLGDVLSGFDPSGILTSFTEGLDLSSLSTLFDGLKSALGGEGISLDGISFGDFDISSILGGISGGDGAGMAGIMDTFSGVLESLGLDSSVIESLLDNDIVNFFANLYLGGVEPSTETPTEPTAPENPKMGDTSTVMVAIATLSVASAAAFVCTRKKHA